MSFKCYGCTERHDGCHSTCESYLSERKRLDEINERIFRENQTNVGINEVRIRGIRKAMRKRGKKW
jgi:hypothetical protein